MTKTAQILQFVFFAAVAAGTIAGGPIGDRVGRKVVIWVSILGVLPFSLLLPHVGLVPTVGLSAIWRDDGAIGGFAHRIVSGLATAEAEAVSVEDSLVYRVPDERGARFLAAGFGDGRVPGPEEEYVIAMEIWDPDGRLDENGRLVATTYLEVGP